jgi:hypothetical protein
VINLKVDRASVDSTVAYIDQVKERILAGIRSGMQEAMEGLAGAVESKLEGDPIVSRTGELASAIAKSPKVTETATIIRGTVTADVGLKHLGIWLEEGTHVPAVDGKLYEFTEADGDTFFARGHRAFDVKPHPFMNPALDEMKAPIMQIIADAVAEATDAGAAA